MRVTVKPTVISVLETVPKGLERGLEELVVGWLFGFYGLSTFMGYLKPNPFLCT